MNPHDQEPPAGTGQGPIGAGPTGPGTSGGGAGASASGSAGAAAGASGGGARGVLLGGVLGRGAAGALTSDAALLRAMLDVEAALARALERAGLAPEGSGAAVTAAAGGGPDPEVSGAAVTAAAGGRPGPEGSGAAVTAAARGRAGSEGSGDAVAAAGGRPGPGDSPASVPVPDRFDAAALGQAAAGGGNPVIPLVRELTAAVPEEFRGAVHLGATSQDVLDTALMLVVARAGAAIADDLDGAADAAAALARAHRDTPMAGRTLLQQALPTTFGLTAATWLTGLDAARRRVRSMAASATLQYGGAAGTLASLQEHAHSPATPPVQDTTAPAAPKPSPASPSHRQATPPEGGVSGLVVVGLFAEEVGLAEPVVPWHTERHRITETGAALAVASGAVAKVARDITLLAQTEVGEVSEAAPGGSSTLPHKRNPVAAVSALGSARQAPGLAATLFANAEHEHQRAAGAWHAEWEPLLALLRATGSAAAWIRTSLEGLRADEKRMRANLDLTGGLMLAERVTTLLTPSLGRLAAHDLVEQACAAAAEDRVTLVAALTDDPARREALDRAGVTPDAVARALDPAGYLGSAARFVDRALTAHRSTAHVGGRPESAARDGGGPFATPSARDRGGPSAPSPARDRGAASDPSPARDRGPADNSADESEDG